MIERRWFYQFSIKKLECKVDKPKYKKLEVI